MFKTVVVTSLCVVAHLASYMEIECCGSPTCSLLLPITYTLTLWPFIDIFMAFLSSRSHQQSFFTLLLVGEGWSFLRRKLTCQSRGWVTTTTHLRCECLYNSQLVSNPFNFLNIPLPASTKDHTLYRLLFSELKFILLLNDENFPRTPKYLLTCLSH